MKSSEKFPIQIISLFYFFILFVLNFIQIYVSWLSEHKQIK